MPFTVRHLTVYRYSEPVELGEHHMMFRPRESHDLRLLEARLDINPRPTRLRWLHDVFDNSIAIATFDGSTTELRFDSVVTLEHVAITLPDYPLEEFDRTMAVNVRGVFLGLRHVIPAMRRRGGGAIVNVSSQAGLRGVPELSAYSASKHAVIGLTRAAALENVREGISVNTVCPGPTDTRMMRAIEETVERQGGDPSGFAERIPIGRYGRPEEIAALVVWLLAEAPAFLTGAVLPIDGGMTVP